MDEAATDFAWPGWDHGVITVESRRELNAGLQTDQRGVAEHFAPAMFAAELPAAELAWIVDEMCRVPPAVASAVLLDQTLVDHRESLSDLRVDTLVCFGRDAKLLSVAAGEDVAARIPGARLQVFEDSSHCPFLEEPAAFNAAVSAFACRQRMATT